MISAQAPRRLPWGGYAWYDINFTGGQERFGDPEQALESLKKVVELIKDVKAKYQTGKTVLLVFSQGAIISYALSLRYPDLIDKVLALSGYIFQGIMPQNPDQAATSHLEYFVSHGTVDEVIPVEWARNADAWLTAHGLQHQYKEYYMGHGINPACFQDMMSWIDSRYRVL